MQRCQLTVFFIVLIHGLQNGSKRVKLGTLFVNVFAVDFVGNEKKFFIDCEFDDVFDGFCAEDGSGGISRVYHAETLEIGAFLYR